MNTKITFKYETKNKTSVLIMREDKIIGRVWSEHSGGTTPYPHDKTVTCLNSIQICGFDKLSEMWGCGPFKGKKDIVAYFNPIDDEWYKNQAIEYSEYVKRFFDNKVKKVKTGCSEFSVVTTTAKDKIIELKSFNDWIQTSVIE